MATSIHPTAIVEPGAELGVDCEIHPYAIVKRWVKLGDRSTVHPFAVVGGDPQDLKFSGVTSWARIGAGVRIREHVTIHRATGEGQATVIGDNCLLMAGAHVAHDCIVGKDVVIANAVLLAGHVEVGDYAILGGGGGFHQFMRIGEGTMVGGGARCTVDLPPFSLAAERDELVGLNVLGLKRRGVPREAIREIKAAFQLVYTSAGNIREVAAQALASGQFSSAEAGRFLGFFAGGKRGFARARSLEADETEKD